MSKKSGSSSEIKKELFMIILVDIQMKMLTKSYILPPQISLSTSSWILVVSTTGNKSWPCFACKILRLISNNLSSEFAMEEKSPRIVLSPSCFTVASSTLRVWISPDKLLSSSRWYAARVLSLDLDLLSPMPLFCEKSVPKQYQILFFNKHI